MNNLGFIPDTKGDVGFVPDVPPTQGFDPEGSGYDVETARPLIEKYPLTVPKPDKYQGDYVGQDGAFESWVWHPEINDYKKHQASRNPETGQILKGQKHPTYNLTIQGEKEAGYIISKGSDDKYYSQPVSDKGNSLGFIPDRPVNTPISSETNTPQEYSLPSVPTNEITSFTPQPNALWGKGVNTKIDRSVPGIEAAPGQIDWNPEQRKALYEGKDITITPEQKKLQWPDRPVNLSDDAKADMVSAALHNTPEFLQHVVVAGTRLDPFKVRQFVAEKVGAYYPAMADKVQGGFTAKDMYNGLELYRSQLTFKDPKKYTDIAAGIGNVMAEFSVMPGGGPVAGISEALSPGSGAIINTALKFAEQTAAQLPVGAESDKSWGQFTKDRAIATAESALTGAAVGAVGKAIPNPWLRIPTVVGGFSGMAAAEAPEGQRGKAALESAITVLGFEAVGLAQKGLFKEATDKAIETNPELSKVEPQDLDAMIKGAADLASKTPSNPKAPLPLDQLRSEGGMRNTDELAGQFAPKAPVEDVQANVQAIPNSSDILRGDGKVPLLGDIPNFGNKTPLLGDLNDAGKKVSKYTKEAADAARLRRLQRIAANNRAETPVEEPVTDILPKGQENEPMSEEVQTEAEGRQGEVIPQSPEQTASEPLQGVASQAGAVRSEPAAPVLSGKEIRAKQDELNEKNKFKRVSDLYDVESLEARRQSNFRQLEKLENVDPRNTTTWDKRHKKITELNAGNDEIARRIKDIKAGKIVQPAPKPAKPVKPTITEKYAAMDAKDQAEYDSAPSKGFVEQHFGNVNLSNKNALAQYLDGKVAKFTGLPNRKWVEPLEAMGIPESLKQDGVTNQEIAAFIKSKYPDFSSPSSEAGSAPAGPALSEAPTEKTPEKPSEYRDEERNVLQAAVERGESLSTTVLQKFSGEKWADDALSAIADKKAKNKAGIVEYAGDAYKTSPLDPASMSDPKQLYDGKYFYHVVSVNDVPATSNKYGNPVPAAKKFTVRKIKPDGSGQTKNEIILDSRDRDLKGAVRIGADVSVAEMGDANRAVGGKSATPSLESQKAAALAAVKEPVSIEPVSEQERSPALRVVNREGEKPPAVTTPDKPVDPKKFYIYWNNENGKPEFREVKGTKVTLPGYEKIDAFSHKDHKSGWSISDGKTGGVLGSGRTKKDAYETTLRRLEIASKSMNVPQFLEEQVKKSGLSPRYGGKAAEAPAKAVEATPAEKPVEEPKKSAVEHLKDIAEEKIDKPRSFDDEDVIQEAKAQAAGKSLMDFLNSVAVVGNEVNYGTDDGGIGITIHEYRPGYYPTNADLETLHSVLKERVRADAAAKGDKTGELFADTPQKEKKTSWEDKRKEMLRSDKPYEQGEFAIVNQLIAGNDPLEKMVKALDGIEDLKNAIKTQSMRGKLKPATQEEIGKVNDGKQYELTYERYVMAVRDVEGYGFAMDAISRELHKGHIIEAIVKGKKVPDNVLAEYPDIDVKDISDGAGYMPQQSWQMSRKDYVGQGLDKINQSGKTDLRTEDGRRKADLSLGDAHEAAVKEARDAGKPVPAEVLAEYGLSPKGAVSENTLITAAMKDAAVARQESRKTARKTKGKNQGTAAIFTADDVKDAAIEMGYYAEQGIRTAADFTKKAIEVLGEDVRPHFEAIWNELKKEGVVKGDFNPVVPPPTNTPPTPPAGNEPPTETPPTPPSPGDKKVRGVAQSLENSAVASGAIAGPGGLGDLATYDVHHRDVTDKIVAKHEAAQPGITLEVAMGRAEPAEGALPQDYFRNAHNRARQTADGNLFMELNKSPFAKRATETGQENAALDTGDRSGIDALQDLKDISAAHTDAAQRRAGVRSDSVLQGDLVAKETEIRRLQAENIYQKELIAQKAPSGNKNPGDKAPRASKPRSEYGSTNRGVKKARAEALSKELKEIFSSLGANPFLDPRIMEKGLELGLYHAEALGRRGATMFAEWSAKMREQAGDKITPYLKPIYDKVMEGQRDEIHTRIKDALAEKGGDILAIRNGVAELARQHIAEGVRGMEKVVDALHADLKEIIPSITREQTYNAFAKYGDFKEASKDEVEVEYRQSRSEALLVSQLKDLERGVNPKATGAARVEPRELARKLRKLVNEAKKKAGFVVVDAARQIKTALATKETRLKNRITDVKAEIASGQRLIKNKAASPDNARTIELQKELDGLLAEHKAIFGNRKLTDQQKLDIATKYNEKAITELDRRISTGDISKPVAPDRPMTPELKALITKKEALQKQLADMREAAKPRKTQAEKDAASVQRDINSTEKAIGLIAAKIMQGDVRPTVVDRAQRPSTPELNALKDKLEQLHTRYKEIRADAVRIENAEKSTQRSIDDLQRRIDAGQLLPEAKTPGPTSDKLRSLKAVQETLKGELKTLREADPAYVAEMNRRSDEQYEKTLAKRNKAFEDQIAAGTYGEPKTRRERQLSAEAKALRETLNTRRSLARDKVTVTPEQADKIAVMAKDAVDKKEAWHAVPDWENKGPGTPEGMAFSAAVVDYQDYVAKLKHDASKKTWTDIKEEFKQTPVQNTVKALLNVVNISKAIRGAWDLSYNLRQGVKAYYTSDIPDLITALPRFLREKGGMNVPRFLTGREVTDGVPRFIGSRTLAKSLEVFVKTLGGKDVVRAMKIYQRSDPMFDLIKRTKADIVSIEEAHPADMTWIDHLPGVGRAYRASENGYVLASHFARFELTKLHLQIAKAAGTDFEGKEGDRQLEAIGKLVNSLTARGKIGNKNNAPGWVNALMWAPKMLKGNVDVLLAHSTDPSMYDTYAIKAARLDLLKVIAGQALILAIAKAIDPDSVELDYRSPDAGKIKIGDTRHDISGGMDTIRIAGVRLLLAMLEPVTGIPAVKSSSGETHFVTKGDWREGGMSIIWDFLVNKSTPAGTIIQNHLKGFDRQGDKVSLLGDLRDLFAPLPATTAQELLSNPNRAPFLLSMTADWFGSSSNTYPDAPYVKVKRFIEDSSQSIYKKPASDITAKEYKAIIDSPGYKQIEIEYKQTKRQGPARFQQSADVYEAGKAIYDGLPDTTRKSLFDRGVMTIGISDKVDGQPLSPERFKEYAAQVSAVIQYHAKDIEAQSDKDLPEYISYLKEVARMTDQELGIAIYKKVKDGIKPDQAAHLRVLTSERDRRSKQKK